MGNLQQMADLIRHKIAESMNDLVYVSSADYKVVYMNHSLIARTGRDATGECCYKAIHDQDEICPWCVTKIVEQGKSLCCEICSPKDDHTYHVSHVPISDADGAEAQLFLLHDITERRKIEGSLRKEKNFSDGLISSLPGMFSLLNENLQFIRWNRNLEEISGYSADEIAGMQPLDFFAGREKELIAEKISEVLECGNAAVESNLVMKSGNSIPYFFKSSRISINDKPHLIVTGLDFLERHETDALLRKLSRAVEQCASYIVITDTEGTIEYVNSSFLQMTGYTLEEVIGQNPLKKGADTQLPDIFGSSWQTVTEDREWRGEQQNRKKSGEPYWELLSVSPIKNADEITTHYLAVKEDITAQKTAERELLKSKAELLMQHEKLKHLFAQVEMAKEEWESTLDCIADIVILADTENRIKRYNMALLELTSRTHQEIIGRNWQEIFSEHGLCIPSPCAPGTELCHKLTGNWFVFNSYPFAYGSNKEVSGVVVTLHDITVVKRFTSELEKAYSDLKATQARVVQQEKMASIGQLAAGVAHEINNPMGFISSNLGTLAKYTERQNEFIKAQSEVIETLMDKDAVEALRIKRVALKIDYILEDGRELIKESLDGAERVRTIVQNLKSFSRVDEAEYKPTDINECITSTINIVWNELKYKVNLVKELGDIPPINCYPQQLNQVFMNLLINAAQAIEKQGEITVKSWHENGSVYVSVSDTGCGIPREVLNRIFEPFFTTKEVGKGTGLGLSIIYDIIKNHDGEIAVESEPGKGTTFTVRLPIAGDKGLQQKQAGLGDETAGLTVL